MKAQVRLWEHPHADHPTTRSKSCRPSADVQMTEPIDLPPEIQQVADLLSEQPRDVRELFRYALVLAMIDDEKARIDGTRVEEEGDWLTIETIAGDVFEIIRPPISEELEAQLMEQVRAIVEEDSSRQ
jgi:hypothetical protein